MKDDYYILQISFLVNYRKHIEVHGRPTPAVFRSSPEAGGRPEYSLVWTVDSYSPIEEYRLLYRQIQPYHKVSCCVESTKKKKATAIIRVAL